MFKKQKTGLSVILVVLLYNLQSLSIAQIPIIGAEVYLEPGQSAAQIDTWFKRLNENKMPVARVFMMWNFLEPKPDGWDFTLWDAAFKSAEKYRIRITATLVPNSPPFHWGKPYHYVPHLMDMFENEDYRKRSEKYIQKVVERYQNSPALDSWWLYNEPGQFPAPDHLAMDGYRVWLKEKYLCIDSLNKAWLSYYPSFEKIEYDQAWKDASWVWPAPFLDWNRFWRVHVNAQIQWLADQVKKYDQKHPTTTNIKNILDLPAHYDLKGLRKPLNSIGTSLHPSWDFYKLKRSQYSLAVSWANDFLRGAADSMEYWVSELQGGNNLYSGLNPLCPTEYDIAQWVWTSIGSGAKRVIFWCLNSRMQGVEAAEWAMLDFQDQPSVRMLKAKQIAEVINANQSLFSQAKPISPHATILVSKESSLIQERKQNKFSQLEGVKESMHFKSSFICYQSLMERGVQVDIKEISDYNWGDSKEKQVIVLASAMALSAKDIDQLKSFVSSGNKLIIMGLTGLFDINEKVWSVNRTSPFAELTGGTFKNIQFISEKFFLDADGISKIPTHAWETEILQQKGKVIGSDHEKIIALKNLFDGGEVIWIPSPIDIGGWIYGNSALGEFLNKETRDITALDPFKFSKEVPGCFMKTMAVKEGYLTFLTNTSDSMQSVSLRAPKRLIPRILYGKGAIEADNLIAIPAGETLVTSWTKGK